MNETSVLTASEVICVMFVYTVLQVCMQKLYVQDFMDKMSNGRCKRYIRASSAIDTHWMYNDKRKKLDILQRRTSSL